MNETTQEIKQEIKPKVMIVDDDKFLLDMYSLKFTKTGYDVTAVANGSEALAKLKDNYTPDILVMDIIMPVMDGLTLLKKVREEKLVPSATVVVLSNQGQREDIEAAQAIGIDGYIIKALTIPTEVVDQVETIYKSKKTLHA